MIFVSNEREVKKNMSSKRRHKKKHSINFMELSFLIVFILGTILATTFVFAVVYLVFQWIGFELGQTLNVLLFGINFIMGMALFMLMKISRDGY